MNNGFHSIKNHPFEKNWYLTAGSFVFIFFDVKSQKDNTILPVMFYKRNLGMNRLGFTNRGARIW